VSDALGLSIVNLCLLSVGLEVLLLWKLTEVAIEVCYHLFEEYYGLCSFDVIFVGKDICLD
jgi:hypothetical protein